MNSRVGLFTTCGWDYISSPLMNSAIFLSQRNLLVDIFAKSPASIFKAPEFKSDRIKYIQYQSSSCHRGIYRFIHEIYTLYKILNKNHYDFFIGFDQDGLFNAAVLGLLQHVPFIYHSLEIVSEEDLIGIRQKIRKRIERFCNKRALLTITQDARRAEILACQNHLNQEHFAIVYNTSLGCPLPEKRRWLREMFEIPDSKTIVLAVGSLITEHMVEQIVESVITWPDHFCLVLHGWFPNIAVRKRVEQIATMQEGRIFISTTLLPHEKKDIIFQSADIGLVMYKPINNNLRYAGTASGKLFDFLRCGIPVIANDLPSLREFIMKNECGVIIPDCSELAEALSVIENGYERFKWQAIRTYQECSFEKCYDNLLNEIS